jgi:flagellar hook assembly protein FlgD
MAATTVRVAEPAPAMAGVQQSHKRWREGRNLASITAGGRPPVGTIFSFALNEQASVTLTFTHRVERKRRTKTVTAGKLTLAAHAGTDEVFFDGRLARRHQLPPGSYTVTITAINAAGQSSAPVRLRFTIVA